MEHGGVIKIKPQYIEFTPTAESNFLPMLKSEWLQWRLNKTPLWNIPMRNFLLRHLVSSIEEPIFAVQIPFHISSGNRTYIGKNFFANYNCTIIDHLPLYYAPKNIVLLDKMPVNSSQKIDYRTLERLAAGESERTE